MSDSNGNGTLKRARSTSPANGRTTQDERQQGTGKKQNTGKPQASNESASAASPSTGKGTDASRMSDTNGNKENAAGSSQQGASSEPQASGEAAAPQITIKALIVTQDASIIIGKAGVHIKEIREKAGARVSVSDQIPGNPERILNVTGPLDAVSKVSSTETASTVTSLFADPAITNRLTV